jgi:hypothetical protein
VARVTPSPATAARTTLIARCAAQGNVDVSSAPAANSPLWDGLTLTQFAAVMLPRQDDLTEAALWAWVAEGQPMVRHSKMRSGRDLVDGIEVKVGRGTKGKDTTWRLTTDLPVGGYVLGTTPLEWDEIPAPSAQGAVQQDYSCPAAAVVGSPVYVDGTDSVALARGDDTAKAATHVVAEKLTATTCRAAGAGRVSGLSGLTPGAVYWLAATGGTTAIAPLAGAEVLAQRLGVAASATDLDLAIQRLLMVV